jgi:hypothetical protein
LFQKKFNVFLQRLHPLCTPGDDIFQHISYGPPTSSQCGGTSQLEKLFHLWEYLDCPKVVISRRGLAMQKEAVWVTGGKPERTCEEEDLFLSKKYALSKCLEENLLPHSCRVIVIK